MLQPNYLADIRVESANASAYAQSANAKSVLAESYAIGGTGTREGEDTDNAKYYMEQAKQQTGGIPTKVSELENDAGYITKDVDNLTNYYDKITTDQKLANIDLTDYLKKTGDASNTTVTFTEPTELAQPTTGEKLSGIIGKVSLAIKNIKTLISLIGNTDISSIGNGTVTGAISDVTGKLIAPDYQSAVAIQSNYTCITNGYVIGTIQGAVNGWASIRSSKNANYFLALCTSSENPIAVCIPFASGDSVIFGSSGTYNLAFAPAK